MKCLLVTAHPLAESLGRTLADQARKVLESAGHEVVEEDLYARGFDPCLTVAERRAYYASRHDPSAVAGEAARLRAAEAVILVFPTWWFGFPAILKGWFDRVWAPGVAYDHDPDFGPIVARLDRLRHVVAITTLGAPWWVDRLVLWQPVRRVLDIALLQTCAPQCRLTMLSFYKCERLDARRVDAFRHTVGRGIVRALRESGPRPWWQRLLP
jgi:putative NADPH-quinone reductase